MKSPWTPPAFVEPTGKLDGILQQRGLTTVDEPGTYRMFSSSGHVCYVSRHVVPCQLGASKLRIGDVMSLFHVPVHVYKVLKEPQAPFSEASFGQIR